MSATDDPSQLTGTTMAMDLASSKASRDRYRLAEAADWVTLAKRLTRYAMKRCTSRRLGADPEDFAQEAIRHFFEHMDKWDHVNVPLERHLALVLGGIVVNVRRKGSTRTASEKPRKAQDGDVDHAEAAEDSQDPHAPGGFKPAGAIIAAPVDAPRARDEEDALASRTRARLLVKQTWAALAADPIALEVMAQFAEGTDMLKEQAHAIGRPTLDVLAARKRIQRKVKQLREELEGSDES